MASAGLSLYPLSLISRRHRGPDPDGGGGLTLIGSEATSRRLRGTDRRTLSKNRAAELDGRFPKARERERDSSRPPPPPGGERRDRRDREVGGGGRRGGRGRDY